MKVPDKGQRQRSHVFKPAPAAKMLINLVLLFLASISFEKKFFAVELMWLLDLSSL